MYKFIQIWGNCLCLYILGENIVKGPVDNVLTKNKKCLQAVLNDEYLEHIKTATFIQSEREIGFEGDSPLAYDSDLVRIVHNNPLLDSYKKRTEERCNNLRNFLKEVKKNKNYFLLYSLNNFDVNRKTHKLRNKTLVTNIEYLKKLNLLDKVVFVGSHGKDWSDFWTKDIDLLIKKYNLKYLEVKGVKSWKITSKKDLEDLHKQFIKGFEKALKQNNKPKSINIKDKTKNSKELNDWLALLK